MYVHLVDVPRIYETEENQVVCMIELKRIKLYV